MSQVSILGPTGVQSLGLVTGNLNAERDREFSAQMQGRQMGFQARQSAMDRAMQDRISQRNNSLQIRLQEMQAAAAERLDRLRDERSFLYEVKIRELNAREAANRAKAADKNAPAAVTTGRR